MRLQRTCIQQGASGDEQTYGRTWLESNARNGSMSAIQLSQAELLYNPEYARQCDAFGDKVENEWRKK
ncbi:hypothetical protein [Leclercia pneumoniae]|uniref:hypothetical protein n=1 Tax=Leclercia pneumoniae TaxID=2815358 RepID=UPI001F5F6FC5|nr:hypothetical protein [Leclercia pneumoniae]